MAGPEISGHDPVVDAGDGGVPREGGEGGADPSQAGHGAALDTTALLGAARQSFNIGTLY